jgi:hypothetical protein
MNQSIWEAGQCNSFTSDNMLFCQNREQFPGKGHGKGCLSVEVLLFITHCIRQKQKLSNISSTLVKKKLYALASKYITTVN